MLLGIYLEDGNYGRSQALLEETFQTRAAQKDESIRTYFAAAGQTINGIRSHLARYRSYGINPSDADLPAEANTDLERVRGLLERVIAQAQEISKEAGSLLRRARASGRRARHSTVARAKRRGSCQVADRVSDGAREDGLVADSGRVARSIAGARCSHQQNSQSVCNRNRQHRLQNRRRASKLRSATPALPRHPSRNSSAPAR